MIEIKNIEKAFGAQQVLKGISTTFETGQCNLIIGRSGSGKTVFLKCMVGLFHPDKGEIKFDGRDVIQMDRKAKQEIGRAHV
jgi:phospholipid/cholesterol/gamma-HCH transport system ATP-binding protein